MSLIDYQKPHVDQLITAFNNSNMIIDSSDTGTGKTYSAAAVAEQLGLKPIIVCPKSVISSWIKVMKQFKVDIYGISNYESLRSGSWFPEGDLTKKKPCKHISITRETCVWTLPADVLIIFDEAHKCKNPATSASRMLLAAVKTGAKIMTLSATIADTPKFFATFAVGIGFCDNIRVYPLYLRKLQGLSGLEPMLTLHRRVFPHHGSRMKIVDLGDKFPRNLVISDTYFMGEDIAKSISQQYQLIDLVAKEAKRLQDGANCVLVQIIRARQRIEALKVSTIKELAIDHLNSGLSVAIFVNYVDTLRLLSEELDCNCFIQGGQTLVERDMNIELFQSNKERLIISTIQSGGVGISLHDTDGRYPRVSLISPSWSGQDLVQALGRIHRAGAKSPCIQKLVYCQGTIEEDICKMVQKKLNNYSQLNDNDNESQINLVS